MRDGDSEDAREPPIEFIASHRMSALTSGVGRFNEIIAEGLGVAMIALFDDRLPRTGSPLLSFKVSELSDIERAHFEEILDEADWSARVFLHDWNATELERRMVRTARVVYCGNHEILERVRGLNARLELAWSPGLLRDTREFQPAAVSVFSFGMAHKLRGDMFLKLRELLERSGQDWVIYVSAANHETQSLSDANDVFHEISSWFPAGLYFLGNLSDVAVYNFLRVTTFFAAFFDGGVRANNGSVSAAMEHGAVVITNLDEHSPPQYVHMHNIIDINQCDTLPPDPALLAAIGANAAQTSARRGFPQLLRQLNGAAAVAGS